ncbi:MAG: putative quinol monooxygenase [Acidobacteriota bacterium]|nr:antibiotic biosynthesis monooxygenase [Blastocatellia bacterium]MDW8240785.1 putative quinol monooxygenase [Acidobacteriota bacterium]
MPKHTLRVVARIIARPDKVEELRSLLMGLIEPTRKEPGCIAYELLQNKADETDFTFVEEWEDDAALDAHLASPHVREALSKAPALLAAEPDIRRYNVVG